MAKMILNMAIVRHLGLKKFIFGHVSLNVPLSIEFHQNRMIFAARCYA